MWIACRTRRVRAGSRRLTDSRGSRLGLGGSLGSQFQIILGQVFEDPLLIRVVDSSRIRPRLVGEDLIAPLQKRAKLRAPLHVLLLQRNTLRALPDWSTPQLIYPDPRRARNDFAWHFIRFAMTLCCASTPMTWWTSLVLLDRQNAFRLGAAAVPISAGDHRHRWREASTRRRYSSCFWPRRFAGATRWRKRDGNDWGGQSPPTPGDTYRGAVCAGSPRRTLQIFNCGPAMLVFVDFMGTGRFLGERATGEPCQVAGLSFFV